MTDTGKPTSVVSSRELQRLARRMERDAALRRKLLKRVAELEGSIRQARRLFDQLVASVGASVDVPPGDQAPEVGA